MDARGRNGHGDKGIRAAIVEKPLAVEEHQAFGEGGSGGILAGAFPGLFRAQDRLIEALKQSRR